MPFQHSCSELELRRYQVTKHLLILGRALADVLLLPTCRASSRLLSLCQCSLPRTQLRCPLCAGRLGGVCLLRNALGLLLSCHMALLSWHAAPCMTLQDATVSSGCSAQCQLSTGNDAKFISSCQVRSLPCGCATASLPHCGHTLLRLRHGPWPPPALPGRPPAAPAQSPLQ